MRDISTGILGRLQQRRSLRQWGRLAKVAKTANEKKLRTLRRMSLTLGEQISAVSRTSTARLGELSARGNRPDDLPPSTDWWHRPQAMVGPIRPSGAAPARSETPIGADMTLYHDSHTPSLAIRQFRQNSDGSGAPLGLKIDVYEFDGSFFSLVAQTPTSVVDGLLKKHLLRLSLCVHSEQPLEISARLNLKHGPNTEQVSHELACSAQGAKAEFDLAYVPFGEGRAEQVWFDIFLQSPAMNQVTITEFTLSRHRRSEL